MTTALFKIFARRPQITLERDVDAVLVMNARMQRILDCHARLNVQPRALPGTEKTT